MTRRALLTSALLAGCGRKLAPRYFGWLFVASASERGIAVADLAEFRRAGTISLNQIPGSVLRSGERVFVTCPDVHSISVIDPSRLSVSGKIDVPGQIVAAAIVPGSGALAVLIRQPALLLLIDPASGRVTKKIRLPAAPLGFDINDRMSAVAVGGSIVRVSITDAEVLGTTAIGADCGPVRFRVDGETILAGVPHLKEVVTVDAASGALLARLTMPFAPARFCFNEDGGQMFVTGMDGDAIVIVDTFQNQVDETFIAGSKPYGMAVGSSDGQSLLFVTNTGSGNLTIFDIDTRHLAASVYVGGNPGEVLLTPGGEYALVIGRDSGDVSVIRLQTVLNRGIRTKPLFTVFATGTAPRSAAIIPSRQL
ncbi:MAG: YncE family protein [Terriglobia bacterium]